MKKVLLVVMSVMFLISCGGLESDAKRAGNLLCESKIAESNGDDAKAKKLREKVEKIREKYNDSPQYREFEKIANLEYWKCATTYKQEQLNK